MRPVRTGRGQLRSSGDLTLEQYRHLSRPAPSERRDEPRTWWSTIGFGYRSPDPAMTGPQAARISPWRRLRSSVLLAALLVLLGVALAAAVGVLVFLAGFVLEQAISG
jgi:hypothetical protein